MQKNWLTLLRRIRTSIGKKATWQAHCKCTWTIILMMFCTSFSIHLLTYNKHMNVCSSSHLQTTSAVSMFEIKAFIYVCGKICKTSRRNFSFPLPVCTSRSVGHKTLFKESPPTHYNGLLNAMHSVSVPGCILMTACSTLFTFYECLPRMIHYD